MFFPIQPRESLVSHGISQSEVWVDAQMLSKFSVDFTLTMTESLKSKVSI